MAYLFAIIARMPPLRKTRYAHPLIGTRPRVLPPRGGWLFCFDAWLFFSHTRPAREARRCRSRRCCSAEPPSTCGGMRRSACAERRLLLQPPVLLPIFRGLDVAETMARSLRVMPSSTSGGGAAGCFRWRQLCLTTSAAAACAPDRRLSCCRSPQRSSSQRRVPPPA